MDLETAIRHLQAAGFEITAHGGQLWHVQYGQGPEALDVVVPSETLITVAANFAQPELRAPASMLDPAEVLALLRAAGLLVEPAGVGQWAVRRTANEAAILRTTEELLAIGRELVAFAPWLRNGTRTPNQPTQPSVDPTRLLLVLARLGRITTPDLAALLSITPAQIAAQLESLRQQGQIALGPEATWTLTEAGWDAIGQYIQAGDPAPSAVILPTPALGHLTARLLTVFAGYRWSRFEIAHPSLAGIPDGHLVRVTIAHNTQGIALTRNLAAQARLSGLMTKTITIVLITPEQTSAPRIAHVLDTLRQPIRNVLTDVPCLVAEDDRSLPAIAAAMHSHGWTAWMLTTIDRAYRDDWGVFPSNMSVDRFVQAMMQTRN